MPTLLFFLACFGATYVVVDSILFVHVRLGIASRGNLAEAFIYCAYCTGFWIAAGLHVAVAVVGSTPVYLFDAFTAGLVLMGMIALIRAFAPSFLVGAHTREQNIRQALRDLRDVRSAGDD